MKIKDRKIVVVNQRVSYLTIGLCNAFIQRFEKVGLITGSVHPIGEELDPVVKITYINKWCSSSSISKFFSYLLGCIFIYFLLLTKYRKYEVFFVATPPMGYLLNILLPHRFSMLIWDVYPDAFKITGMKETHLLYRVWKRLNKISFRKAYKLFTISEKMADLLESYINKEKIIIQPIWSIFQENNKVNKEENPFVKKYDLQDKFVVQYSGNIGLTHNVETLIDVAVLMEDNQDFVFQIIGRGPRKAYLEMMVKERNLSNCVFLPFQTDEMFHFSLSGADVGVVVLDDTTSKGSVPSKSYNLMSYGIPSLYIASDDSQLKLYAEKYGHAACFSKNELNKIIPFLNELKNNSERYNKMSRNAEIAAEDFRRDNADRFVEKYLS